MWKISTKLWELENGETVSILKYQINVQNQIFLTASHSQSRKVYVAGTFRPFPLAWRMFKLFTCNWYCKSTPFTADWHCMFRLLNQPHPPSSSWWRYSPGWALASSTMCLQASRFLALSFHSFNLLAPEFHIQILAHPVCKRWIIQEPKKVALWNKRYFEEKNGECAACLKCSVLIFVEKNI
jgi:hypothetical protein